VAPVIQKRKKLGILDLIGGRKFDRGRSIRKEKIAFRNQLFHIRGGPPKSRCTRKTREEKSLSRGSQKKKKRMGKNKKINSQPLGQRGRLSLTLMSRQKMERKARVV